MTDFNASILLITIKNKNKIKKTDSRIKIIMTFKVTQYQKRKDNEIHYKNAYSSIQICRTYD